MEPASDVPNLSLDKSLSRRDFVRATIGTASVLTTSSVLAACGGSSSATTTTASNKPKRGGQLRVAMLGGTPSDSLDGDSENNFPQVMRNFALYNGLAALDASGQSVSLDLAEEITPSSDARTWTIRLRPGITFHNGKTLSADDVVFTLKRIADPKSPLAGASALAPVDFARTKVMDARTVRLAMKTPYATFLDQISGNYYFGIVPVGYNPMKPVGTGAFKLQSFTPGQQSVFVRNPNYFKSGLPYLDQLTIIDSFADPTAALNALQSQSVDLFENAPPQLAAQVKSDPSLQSLISAPGIWVPFTMRTDIAPFNDVRVRRAFRLLVDRTQMLNTSVAGLGIVASDVFGLHDPCFATSLRRQQDVQQAKSLLKAAGHANLKVQLVTAPIAAGAVEAAQVFVQQAKAAGITVDLRVATVTAFFTDYLKWPFAQDFLSYNPYMSLAAQTSIPGAPYNSTHYNDAQYNALYQKVNQTVDKGARCALIAQMQRNQFDKGGYIIPSFNRTLDIMSTKVRGFTKQAGTGIPVGNGDWEHAWIA